MVYRRLTHASRSSDGLRRSGKAELCDSTVRERAVSSASAVMTEGFSCEKCRGGIVKAEMLFGFVVFVSVRR